MIFIFKFGGEVIPESIVHSFYFLILLCILYRQGAFFTRAGFQIENFLQYPQALNTALRSPRADLQIHEGNDHIIILTQGIIGEILTF